MSQKNLNDDNLWVEELELRDVVLRTNTFDSRHFATNGERVSEEPRNDGRDEACREANVLVRLRHRAELLPATFDGKMLKFKNKIKRPASGQSAVIYADEVCLGGGIIV